MKLSNEQLQEILVDYLENQDVDQLLQVVLNCLMKNEQRNFLNENSEIKNKANGYRYTSAHYGNKKFKLTIPRDRLGIFKPLILGILRENQEEMYDLAFELYGEGLSQKAIGKVFNKIYGREYSKSSISNMTSSFTEEMEMWRNRDLDSFYPVLIIDALFSNVKRGNHISNEATFTIIALKENMKREIISLEHFPTESASGWEDVFKSLKQRGLKSTNLVIADGLTGLENVVGKEFPKAKFQKCLVHLKRNILNKVAPRHKNEISDDLKEVFKIGSANYNKEEALERMNLFITKWGNIYKRISNLRNNNNLIYYFTYLDYDYRVQNMLYTTNWVENLNKQYRRVLKIRNSMPKEESILLLLGKVAMDSNIKYLQYGVHNFKFDKDLLTNNFEK